VVDGAVTRTRPLCPYPRRAAYRGVGRSEEASSYVCR
jgi:feruloyl esterase